MEVTELTLPYHPPLDWEALLSFHRYHLLAGIESTTEDAYERIFRIGKNLGSLRVTNEPGQLRLRISNADPQTVARRVRQMFDLDADPSQIIKAFRGQPLLKSLVQKYPGLRLGRGWDPFETAISTILGQLVSTERARALVAQLINHYGEAITHPDTGETVRLFPAPATLLGSDLLEVKTTRIRRRTMHNLARAVVEGALVLDPAPDMETARQQLLAISGIGPWSAEYIALRSLGETDAFPGTDLILKRAIEKHPELDLEAVRPWRSYAAIYLWKHYAGELSRQKKKAK